MKTSNSDRSDYRDFCRLAATSDFDFKRFRHQPVYTGVVETVPPADGAAYITVALRNDPSVASHLDEFRRNDAVGAPMVCQYGPIGGFAPTTLRYVQTATDLKRLFGSLDGMRVVEIGGGYGGQCRILHALNRIASYTIVDLPESLDLAKRYLGEFGVPNVTFAPPDQDSFPNFDLLISNYAYSELDKATQDLYFDRIVSRSRHGYMMYNQVSFAESMPGFHHTVDSIAARIPQSKILSGEPALPPPDAVRGHSLLVW